MMKYGVLAIASILLFIAVQACESDFSSENDESSEDDLSSYNACGTCSYRCPCYRDDQPISTVSFDVDEISVLSDDVIYGGQLVLARPDPYSEWQFAISINNCFTRTEALMHFCRGHKSITCESQSIRVLKPLWQWILQKNPPIEIVNAVWKKYMALTQHYGGGHVDAQIVSKSRVITVIGDLHGSNQSLCSNLKQLHHDGCIDSCGVIAPGNIFIFLGDYTDRGDNGVGVWCILMYLFILNSPHDPQQAPQRVFIIRGNHETMNFAREDFLEHWCEKIAYDQSDQEAENSLEKLYLSLPVAVLIGSALIEQSSLKLSFKFILYCHGGPDNSIDFGTIMRKAVDNLVEKLELETIHEPVSLPNLQLAHVLWNDFFARDNENQKELVVKSKRGTSLLVFNSAAARLYMKKNSQPDKEFPFILNAICRGHEHVKGGISRLYDIADVKNKSWEPLKSGVDYVVRPGDVFTCISSPEGLVSINCTEDSYVQFRMTDSGDWFARPCVRDVLATT